MMEILTHQTTWKVSVMFFHSEWHNYITAITKLDAVWFCHSRGGRLFGGESSLKSRSGGLTITGWHSVSWSFLLVTDPFLGGGAEMWWRVGRTGRRTDTSPCTAAVFFPSYKLPKTVTVTTVLLFGQAVLLCGTFLSILLGEGPV